MIPRPFKQILRYNELAIPKEHRQKNHLENRELWNELMSLNSAFPDEEIIIEHSIKDLDSKYAFDMKLSCSNTQLQKLLHEAYERFMRLPRYSKPANFNI